MREVCLHAGWSKTARSQEKGTEKGLQDTENLPLYLSAWGQDKEVLWAAWKVR
jgi:hypothetical protein